MFVCLSLCVTQVSLLCPFTSCMSKSSVFIGVVWSPDAVRSVCSMSSFLYDWVVWPSLLRSGTPSTYHTCQVVTLSAKNIKNESSSYEPGNSIIYLFCLLSTHNRTELCEVRLNEECIQKPLKYFLQSLTKLKKTSASELQPSGVWLSSLHITDSDKETFHTQSLTPCLLRLFDHSYAESPAAGRSHLDFQTRFFRLDHMYVCVVRSMQGCRLEVPANSTEDSRENQRVFPTSRSLYTVWAEQIHYKVSAPRWRGSKGSQQVK